jgi:beta-lactam-binding protein with PASTA domain
MKRLVALIFAVAVFAVHPAAADDLVTVPNLKGMKGGNDIVGILSTMALNAKFGDPILAPSKKVELTVADTVPHAGTKVPKGSTVLITAYSHYAPVVVGLQLDKATAKLEAEGVPLAGIDVVNAPSPELVNQVVYQGIPDEAGRVTLKVYAPYYEGSEPQTSTATPSTGGGTPPSGVISAGCGSPGGGVVIATSANTPCSLNLAAVFPPSALGDLRLESQPSHGSVVWSNGTLTYTPAPDYRGPDSVTMSTTKKVLVNGQIVNAGRGNQVWGIVVQ